MAEKKKIRKRRLVGFGDKFSTNKDERRKAWEVANAWLEANADTGKVEVLGVTPLLTQNKNGYYVGQVVIEYMEA